MLQKTSKKPKPQNENVMITCLHLATSNNLSKTFKHGIWKTKKSKPGLNPSYNMKMLWSQSHACIQQPLVQCWVGKLRLLQFPFTSIQHLHSLILQLWFTIFHNNSQMFIIAISLHIVIAFIHNYFDNAIWFLSI